MDRTKDYYATLGVLPTAEDVVLRAAYRALAQRYHPDRFNGPKDDANRRMAEINDAYAVLSDTTRRREYDRLRGSRAQAGDSYFTDESTQAPPGADPLERDWQVALKYHPDLRDLGERLGKISWRLAYSFRAYMLEAKPFSNRQQIADAMERQFLEAYFGTNRAIVRFAQELIDGGHKAAAKTLNAAIRVLGSEIDAEDVIRRIRTEFNLILVKPASAKRDLSMGLCPNCDATIRIDSVECPRCHALFEGEGAWSVRPLT